MIKKIREKRYVGLTIAMISAVAILGVAIVAPSYVYAGGGAEEAPEDEQITLTVWNFIDEEDTDDPRGRGYRAVNDAFREQYPDVTLEWEVFPFDEVGDQLLRASAVGRGPDVVREESLWFQRHIEAGTVRPLDEFIAQMPDGYTDDWVYPLESANFGGTQYALPRETRLALYWYRDDVFAEHGIDVPETWEGLAEVTRELSRDGQMGFALALDQGHFTDFFYWLNSQYAAFGANLLDEDNRAIYNNEVGEQIFSYLRDLVHEHGMSTSVFEMIGQEITSAFTAGIVMSSAEGSHRVLSAREGLGDEGTLEVAPIPGPDGPVPITSMGWFLAMGANTEHPEWAWRYMEHVTSPEMQALHAEIAGEMPTRASAFEEPFFTDTEEGREAAGWFELPAQYGSAPLRIPLEYRTFMRGLVMAAHDIVLGGQPIAETLDRYADEFNDEAGH